jgi:hypothetical protein
LTSIFITFFAKNRLLRIKLPFFSLIIDSAWRKAKTLKCLYCGKGLWPLRGLIDSDFCSRPHRQKYHDRVRKALDRLPQFESTTHQPVGMSGFVAAGPNALTRAVAKAGSGGDTWQPAVSSPFVPGLPAPSEPALVEGSFSGYTPEAIARNTPRVASEIAAQDFAQMAEMGELSARLHRTHGALAVARALETPARIALRPILLPAKPYHSAAGLAMVLTGTARHATLSIQAAGLRAAGFRTHATQPNVRPVKPAGADSAILPAPPVISIAAFTPSRMAPALPESAAREIRPAVQVGGARAVAKQTLEISAIPLALPSQTPRTPTEVSSASELAFVLPELAFHAGGHVHSEHPADWQFKVNGFATDEKQSRVASAEPAILGFAGLSIQPAQASRLFACEPLAWQISTQGAVPQSAFQPRLQASEAAFRLTPPAARTWKCSPVAALDPALTANAFALQLPDLSASKRLPLVPSALSADLMPGHADAFGPQTKIGETLLPRGTGWFPMEAKSVLPATPVLGPCAPVSAGFTPAANLGAKKSAAGLTNNSAESMNPALPIQFPAIATQYHSGPAFSVVEPNSAPGDGAPVVTDQFAQGPLRTGEVSLALPQFPAMGAASTQPRMAQGPMDAVGQVSAFAVTTVHVPEIRISIGQVLTATPARVDLRPAAPKIGMPREIDWQPLLVALRLPVIEHRLYPLALKIAAPEQENHTTIVTETVTASAQQTPDRILPITTELKKKPWRERIPKSTYQWARGMAAAVAIVSFLWFGASQVKLSDGSGPRQWVASTLQQRAAYESEDNFHAGLAGWNGAANFAKTWSFDKEGFMRPGKLALYKPSKDMTDYRLEFLAQVERKSVAWAFRATDEQNYYAMKLKVAQQNSPRVMASLVRYVVVDGAKGVEVERPLQMMLHNNRPYRVQVDVKGNQFSTSVEGQLVDTWSDDKLRAGAVGFFAESGDKARLYWMRISKNTDFLGRLCAILAPGGLPGIWMPFVMPPMPAQE